MINSVENNENLNLPYEFDIHDNYAYVCANAIDSLVVIDISNRENPAIVGSVKNNYYLQGPTQPFYYGGYVYVAGFTAHSLVVVDVSVPTNPIIVGGVIDNRLYHAQGIYVEDVGPRRYAYVVQYGAVLGHNSGLTIVDVTTPTSPIVVGSVENIDGGGFKTQVWVHDNVAYVSSVGDKLELYDVTNKASPKMLSILEDPINLHYLEEVIYRDGYVYISSYLGGRVTVVDVSDNKNLVVKGSVYSDALGHPGRMSLKDNYLYVANFDDGIAIVDISSPTNPTIVDNIIDHVYLHGLNSVIPLKNEKYLYAITYYDNSFVVLYYNPLGT